MAEYTDKEAILQELSKVTYRLSDPPIDTTENEIIKVLHTIMRTIKQMPAADVVEVVRCKDCVHCVVREYDIIDELECEFFDVFTDPLDYCSRGERKADNG